MLRWFLADLRTGRQILDLPVLSGRGQRLLNRPETLEVSVDLRDTDVVALQTRNTTAPGKTVLACAVGNVVLGAGPIWARQYDRNDAKLTLSAKGLWSYYDHRHILPLLAATVGASEWTVPDPANEGGTMPNPLLKTALTGWELGTIAKKLVEQAHLWTGGEVPVVFEADRVGVHERNYEGPEFKQLGDVLSQLQEVDGGPDVRFLPRYTADLLGIEWVLETGTEATPLLGSSVTHRWDVTAPESPVSNLSIREDATSLADLGWATGGRAADETLVARAYASTLVDLGYPLFETQSTHGTVVEQPTLDAHAAHLTGYGAAPVEVWSFDVDAESQPFFGAYFEGDYIELDIAPYGTNSYTASLTSPEAGYYSSTGLDSVEPGYYSTEGLTEVEPGYYSTGTVTESGLVGDPYIVEGGTFRHRIVGLSWDQDGEVVSVECAPRGPE
jgi:hypothetical protein